MISTYYLTPTRPDERALRLLDLLARQAADILERSRFEASLRRANVLLAEEDRNKNDFLAMLSHELRNPLAPIVTGLSLIKSVGLEDPRAGRVMAVIERQVAQLSNLVNDLLDVTRITRNKLQLHSERLELNEVVMRAVDDNRSFFEHAGVRIETGLEADGLFIVADRTRLRQILGNVLNNAAKFTARGGLTRVHVRAEAGEAVVSVADDGVGMSRESVAHLFQPFVQADQTLDRSHGGVWRSSSAWWSSTAEAYRRAATVSGMAWR